MSILVQGRKQILFIGNSTNIRIAKLDSDFIYAVLQELDYFVAGREPADSLWIDYASQVKTKVLFGANQNIFSGVRGATDTLIS